MRETVKLAGGLHTADAALGAAWQQLSQAADQQSMQLGITCLVLFAGATLAGLLPLVVTISHDYVQLATAGSAGLLLGAALAVILPEGFESFSKAQDAGTAIPESAVGAAILGGFLVMLLLDQLQEHDHQGHQHPSSSDEDLEAASLVPGRERKSSASSQQLQGKMDKASRAFVGLLIHSLADGLAIGSAVFAGDEALGAAVGVAMTLHKAPAALGLTTFLAAARWPRGRAVRALLLFAAATPAAAVATAGLLSLTPWLSAPAGAALCVLFSGGTFLYASCIHVLPSALGSGKPASPAQLATLLAGSVLPLALISIAGHGH